MTLAGVVVLLSLLVVSQAASDQNSLKFGACVITCSNSLIIGALGDMQRCPDGYECRSNGCGLTCQHVTTVGLRALV